MRLGRGNASSACSLRVADTVTTPGTGAWLRISAHHGGTEPRRDSYSERHLLHPHGQIQQRGHDLPPKEVDMMGPAKLGLSLFFVGLPILLGVGNRNTIQTAPDRPNILLIVVDDMGYSDVGVFGGDRSAPRTSMISRDLVFDSPSSTSGRVARRPGQC